MSQFAEYETIISAAVDNAFGDPVTITPMAKGELSHSADGTRAIRTVTGIVDFNPRAILPKGKEQYDAFQPNLMGEKAHVSFDENLFSDDAPKPRTGDQLSGTLKSGAFKFEIAVIEPDGLGRIVCACKVIKP